jgi:hypothetical protein
VAFNEEAPLKSYSMSEVDYQRRHAFIMPRMDLILPPELQDRVIDFLYDDGKTLKQCSLVCRAWVPAASFHLFRSFHWPSCWIGDATCTSKEAFGDQCFPNLLKVLSASLRVRFTVRTLVLRLHLCGDRQLPLPKVTMQELQSIRNLLPRLRCLTVLRTDISSADIANVPQSGSVAELSVLQGEIQTIANLLLSFSHVSQLSICWTPSENAADVPPSSLPLSRLPLQVDSLKIVQFNAETIIPKLSAVVNLASIHTLILLLPLSESLVNVIHSNLPNISSLSYYTNGEYLPISLRQLHLQSLRLSIRQMPATKFYRYVATAEWYHAMRHLELVALASLRELCISFAHTGTFLSVDNIEVLENFIANLDWKTLGSIAQRCSSLRTLRLEMRGFAPTLPRHYFSTIFDIASGQLPIQRGYVLEVAGEQK